MSDVPAAVVPRIRAAGPQDRGAVERALLTAFNWSPDRPPIPPGQALARPDVAHYVDGWPRPTDVGVVAEVGGRRGAVEVVGAEVVGAAWLRFLPADDPGYGFVAPDVPELSIGVDAAHRGRGVGRALLRAVLAAAAERGIERVSLSVERANHARELYLAEGFVVVGGDPTSDTMVIEVPARAPRGSGR